MITGIIAGEVEEQLYHVLVIQGGRGMYNKPGGGAGSGTTIHEIQHDFRLYMAEPLSLIALASCTFVKGIV